MIRRMPMIGVLVVGLAVGGVAAAGFTLWWQRSQGGTYRAPIGPESIVLLGDSITEEGDWQALLPDHPVVNEGYSGFTSAELIPVADRVAGEQPRLVLILAGTNDIRDDHPPAWTAANLNTIVDRFDDHAPETSLVIQTLLPRADAPAAVVAVNEVIVELAATRGLAVIDLHSDFDNGAGGLRPSESRDGLHLSDAGYRRWAAIVETHLSAESLPALDG